jgi:hypothetical protein
LLAQAQYQSGEKMLAKDVLAWAMHIFRTLAESALRAGDAVCFTRYASLAIDAAAHLAPYESPRLQALALAAPPPAEITDMVIELFEGGLPLIEQEKENVSTH